MEGAEAGAKVRAYDDGICGSWRVVLRVVSLFSALVLSMPLVAMGLHNKRGKGLFLTCSLIILYGCFYCRGIREC